MTESSSAGHPDGAALPADHPLGPAAPIPPLEKEERRAGHESTLDSGSTPTGVGDPGGDGRDGSSGRDDDGHPHADRREAVLDPSAGSAAHGSASIRDEQGIHAAGAVPAAFNGEGSPQDPDEDRHPEDAAAEPDRWDSGGAKD